MKAKITTTARGNSVLSGSHQVDEYIAGFPESHRALLIQMRNTIREMAPDAEESISYGMPAYKLQSVPLVYFGGYAKHIGFYAIPTAHSAFAQELASYKQGKGSVQFPINKPLPLVLIQKMVAFRIKEVSETKMKKSKLEP